MSFHDIDIKPRLRENTFKFDYTFINLHFSCQHLTYIYKFDEIMQ
jgi:hypothetical protein